MSKTKDVFEILKEGLGKVYDGAAGPVAQGSQELAAGIFTGNAFVLYPGAGVPNEQGNAVEPPQGWKEVEAGQEVQPPPTPEVQNDNDRER